MIFMVGISHRKNMVVFYATLFLLPTSQRTYIQGRKSCKTHSINFGRLISFGRTKPSSETSCQNRWEMYTTLVWPSNGQIQTDCVLGLEHGPAKFPMSSSYFLRNYIKMTVHCSPYQISDFRSVHSRNGYELSDIKLC